MEVRLILVSWFPAAPGFEVPVEIAFRAGMADRLRRRIEQLRVTVTLFAGLPQQGLRPGA